MRTTRVAILPSTLFRSRTEGKLPLHYNDPVSEWRYSGCLDRIVLSQCGVQRRNLLSCIVLSGTCTLIQGSSGVGLSNVSLQAVLGVTPLLCGILMLPYSLGGALASVPIALFNDFVSKRTKSTSCYKQAILAGLALSTLGFGAFLYAENCSRPHANCEGLLTLLDVTSSLVIREVYPLIAGIGLGMLFHAPFAALTNGMSSHDRSRATSAFFLVRFIGATSGLVSASH